MPRSESSPREGIGYPLQYSWASLLWLTQWRICLQCRRPRFDPWVGKIWRRALQSTPAFLPGESPWTEEPGRLQSMGSQRVGHNRAAKEQSNNKSDFTDSSYSECQQVCSVDWPLWWVLSDGRWIPPAGETGRRKMYQINRDPALVMKRVCGLAAAVQGRKTRPPRSLALDTPDIV